MSWQKKVVWSEGMFLKPQHFQQQERYFEFFSHTRNLPVEGFFWGFRELAIDPADYQTVTRLETPCVIFPGV